MAIEVTYNVPDPTRLYICKHADTTLYISISSDDINCTGLPGPIDLTGYTVYFTVKRRLADLDSLAILRKETPLTASLTDPAMGLVKITISALETDVFPDWYYDYIYDMKIKDAQSKVITNSIGTFGVYPAVTKAT